MRIKLLKILLYSFILLAFAVSCGTSSSTTKKQSSRNSYSQKRETIRRAPQRERRGEKESITYSFDDEEYNSDNQDKEKGKRRKDNKKSYTILGFKLSSQEDNIELYKLVEKWYGTPYRMGGCSKSGIDCSCFVITIYGEVYNIDLARNTAEIAKQTRQVKKNQLQEGDLVFFKTTGNKISHVGIYLKDNKFAHASSSKGVMVSDLSENYWQKTYFTAGRHQVLADR